MQYLTDLFHPAGVFMEKPQPLHSHASSFPFRFSAHQHGPTPAATPAAPQSFINSSINQTGKREQIKIFLHLQPQLSWWQFCSAWIFSGSLLTIYISKLDQGVSTTIYSFSLNASIESPWKICSTDHEELSSFQVRRGKEATSVHFLIANHAKETQTDCNELILSK